MNKSIRKKFSRIMIAGLMVTSSVMPVMAETIKVPSDLSYTHKKMIGKDRYETGVITAKEANKKNIIVVNGATEKMVDGLCASVLVEKLNATVLPINPNKVSSDAKKIIYNAENVYIIGLEQAIPESFVNTIPSKVNVTRIGGDDRFETSEKIAEFLGGYEKAFLVNGVSGQADAMSMSSVSAKHKIPILLTKKSTSPIEKREDVEYTVVGGTSVISNEVQNSFGATIRIGGKDRYDTNKKVLNTFYSTSETRYFTNGETLIDALSGASLSKDNGITFVNRKKNLDLLKDKNTVQIGGLPFEIDFKVEEDTDKPTDDNNNDSNNDNNNSGNDGGSVPGFSDDEIIDGGGENEEIQGDMSDDDTQVGEM